jgi:hypothetical protein
VVTLYIFLRGVGYSVRFSAGALANLNEGFRGFHQTLQTNVEVISGLGHRRFLTHFFKYSIHQIVLSFYAIYSTGCPKSLEPMGILFIIYIICSICSPRHPTHFLIRFAMFVRILLNILGSTVAQQSVILCLR